MKIFIMCVLAASSAFAGVGEKIMDQQKYAHSIWGLYVKDLETGKVLHDMNSDKFFSPASTTKIFSIAALLQAFGDDYRFKTPVYAAGSIKEGVLQGDLILVAQGDLTMGGRQQGDTIAFTKLDHIIANAVPGTILTKEDPLRGLNELALQVAKRIKEVNGDVVIDDSLFDKTELRGMTLSPIMINENLIDIVINPSKEGQKAELDFRPKVEGYSVDNQVTTGKTLAIEITSDSSGKNIVVSGTIPSDQKDLVRTFSIKDPKSFARDAFVQALKNQGVKVNLTFEKKSSTQNREQIALFTSPPLSEYAKLILKVSHNLGADLVPLLLASQKGKKTFEEGMLLLGSFAIDSIKLSPDEFVFADAAGGNENRLTPKSEVQLLEYMTKQKQFQAFFDALPILGIDGSLEDFAKNTEAAGKVRAKPGTGVTFNESTGKFFLVTQALAGYIRGKNGHTYVYMVVVNNAKMPAINDVLAIFEDEAQISSLIYDQTNLP